MIALQLDLDLAKCSIPFVQFLALFVVCKEGSGKPVFKMPPQFDANFLQQLSEAGSTAMFDQTQVTTVHDPL